MADGDAPPPPSSPPLPQPHGIDAVTVAAEHIQPDSWRGKSDSIQSIQTAHRLALIDAWTTTEEGNRDWSRLGGGNILDLGCGQGDQTGALAATVATVPQLKGCKVYGIDPGPPGYGSPWTLEQAHDTLKRSAWLGPHLSFRTEQDGPSALQERSYSTLVLSHCIWYFRTTTQLLDVFSAARSAGVSHILVAEWALTTSDARATPHLLSALLQSQAPLPGGNIQNTLSPAAITELAEQAGWKVTFQRTLLPNEALQDGRWEVDMALEAAAIVSKRAFGKEDYDDEAKAKAADPARYRLAHAVAANRVALLDAKRRYGKEARSMDVWTAVLVPH